jgi:hypothetical protein
MQACPRVFATTRQTSPEQTPSRVPDTHLVFRVGTASVLHFRNTRPLLCCQRQHRLSFYTNRRAAPSYSNKPTIFLVHEPESGSRTWQPRFAQTLSKTLTNKPSRLFTTHLVYPSPDFCSAAVLALVFPLFLCRSGISPFSPFNFCTARSRLTPKNDIERELRDNRSTRRRGTRPQRTEYRTRQQKKTRQNRPVTTKRLDDF